MNLEYNFEPAEKQNIKAAIKIKDEKHNLLPTDN